MKEAGELEKEADYGKVVTTTCGKSYSKVR